MNLPTSVVITGWRLDGDPAGKLLHAARSFQPMNSFPQVAALLARTAKGCAEAGQFELYKTESPV